MADAESHTETAAPPVPSPDWHGIVQLKSGEGDTFDVDSRAAEAALIVKKFLVDKDEEDESPCQFPVDKARPPCHRQHRVLICSEQPCSRGAASTLWKYGTDWDLTVHLGCGGPLSISEPLPIALAGLHLGLACRHMCATYHVCCACDTA